MSQTFEQTVIDAVYKQIDAANDLLALHASNIRLSRCLGIREVSSPATTSPVEPIIVTPADIDNPEDRSRLQGVMQPAPTSTGQICIKCGGILMQTGTCMVCTACGDSSGGCG